MLHISHYLMYVPSRTCVCIHIYDQGSDVVIKPPYQNAFIYTYQEANLPLSS